ncbi:MAG: DUF3460 family protein [Burkholderiaceae bacterium]
MYESEITAFLRELKTRNPKLEDAQRKGRALLWDRPQDPEFTRQAREARVPQQAYVYYQTEH